jgi:hypothetical protein
MTAQLSAPYSYAQVLQAFFIAEDVVEVVLNSLTPKLAFRSTTKSQSYPSRSSMVAGRCAASGA